MIRSFMTTSIILIAGSLLAATAGAQTFVDQRANIYLQPNYSYGGTPYNYGQLSTLYSTGNIRGGRAFQGRRNFIEDSYFRSPFTRFYRDSVGSQDATNGGIYGPGVPLYQPGSLVSRGSNVDASPGSRTADPFGLMPNAYGGSGGFGSSVFYSPRPAISPTAARSLLSYPLGYSIESTLPTLPGTTPQIRAASPFASGLGLPSSLTGGEETGLSTKIPQYLMPTFSTTNNPQTGNSPYGPTGPSFFGQFQPNGSVNPQFQGSENQPGSDYGQTGLPSQPGQPGQPGQPFSQVPGTRQGPEGLNLLQSAIPYGPQTPESRLNRENPNRQPNPNEQPGSLSSFLKTMDQKLSPDVNSSLSQNGQPTPSEKRRMDLLNPQPSGTTPGPGPEAIQRPGTPQTGGPATGAATTAPQTQLGLGKPNRADEQYYQLGLLDMEAGLYRQAAEAFTTVVQLGSTRSWEARRAEGLARMLIGDYYLSGMLLARTLVENPEMTPSNFRVTAIVNQPKDWQAVESALTRLLKTAPNSPAHSFDMAYLKIFTGRPDEAETYLKVAEKSPEFATAAKVLHEKIKP